MKRSVISLFSLLVISALISCQGGGSKPESRGTGPDWALNPPKSSEYYYFAGFSEGIDAVQILQDAAVNKAKAEAMAYIFEESSVTSVFETYGSLSDDSELKKDMKETLITKSAARLSGVETEKTEAKAFNDDGLQGYQVWVLVKIQKSVVEKERARIISELKRKLELVERNLTEAKTALSDGRILDAVRAYLNAALASSKVEERQDEFPIYISEMGKILANLIIESKEVPKEIDISMKSKISFNVLYAGNNGKVPVSGANIKFTLKDNRGDYTKNSVSGKNGVVEVTIDRLEEVNSATRIYASLYLPLDEMLNLPDEFKKYHNTAKSYIERVNSAVTFKAVNLANLNIPTAVIAIEEKDGDFKKVPMLTSEALSYLQKKGYKTRKFPDSISLKKIFEVNDTALKQLSNEGIKRVFILHVNSDITPTYKESLKRYVGFYALSSQLIDTATGDIIAAKNIRVSGTSESKNGTFEAFIKAAGKQLQQIIE